ncbi:hypothetical protein PHLCEN_2v7225 [Hermanssonia centrifuga]|uniref:Uncharacterized protein n=1 Tax=Hermanssonia centrifuga TaxID=98765 RepID=A0A1U7L4Y9_9APHY|nr:hypothetical protein PHLCEN_2v7225 [Hermanssonia centrifuga]
MSQSILDRRAVFNVGQQPLNSAWGSVDSTLADTLCHDGQPISFHVTAEVQTSPFVNDGGVVQLNLIPLTAEEQNGVKAVELIYSSPGQAGDIQDMRIRTDHIESSPKLYDGRQAGYNREDNLRRLAPEKLVKGSIVRVECSLVRYNVGRPLGGSGWRNWRAGWELKTVTLLAN